MKKFLKEYKEILILSFVFSFMIFIYEQITSYAANITDYWFDIYTFFPVLLGEFFLSFLIIFIVLFVIKKFIKKIYKPIYMLVFALFITLYAEGTYLSSFLPGVDGSEIYWSDYTVPLIISCFFWILIFAVVIILYKQLDYKKFEKYSINATLVVLILISVSTLTTLFTTNALMKKNPIWCTEKNINDVSKNKNFFIIVLDTMDATVFEKAIDKLGVKDKFNDFTFFKDAMSVYPYTKFSVPQLLTGEEFRNQSTFKDYVIKEYDNSKLFDELEKRDYTINIYDLQFPYQGDNYSRFVNTTKGEKIGLKSLIKEQVRLLGYKYLPFPLKRFVNIENLEFLRTRVIEDGSKLFDYTNLYTFNRLKNNKPNIVENNNFIYVHLEGGHDPLNLDYDMNLYKDKTVSFDTKVESGVRVMEEYLRFIKDSGYYDDSVIILMADHGYNGLRSNPMLLVKGSGEHHKFKVSDTKVSYNELIDAYMKLLDNKNSDEIFTNKEERYFLDYDWTDECHIKERKTISKAWEIGSLKETGVTYNCK